MLTREGPFVATDQLTSLFGNRPHLLGTTSAHVQDRTHVQGSDRGMGIPGALCAMFGKDLGQAVGVFVQVFQGHRTVLNKGDGFSVATQRHHDVESCLADLPEGGLPSGFDHLDRRPWQTVVGHQGIQVIQATHQGVYIIPSKLHQQQRVGWASTDVDQGVGNDGGKQGVGPAEFDHGAIDQLHRHWLETHDVSSQRHGLLEGGEVHHAEPFVLGQGREFERNRLKGGQRAFGAHQQVRQVQAAVAGVGPLALRMKNIQVVATHPTHDLGPDLADVLFHRIRNLEETRDQLRETTRGQLHVTAVSKPTEVSLCAVLQNGVDAQHVVNHVAVVQRPRATGVVAGHTAKCALRSRGDIHWEPDPLGLELRIQVIEHQTGLHLSPHGLNVDGQQLAQVFAGVDDQGFPNRLSALRRATTTRQDGHASITCDIQGDAQIEGGLGDHHTDRHDLIDRGIGAVAAT